LAGTHSHEFDLTTLLPGPHYCAACAERVCTGVSALDGVTDVTCDLAHGSLAVEHDTGRLSRADVETSVRRIALEVTDSVAHAAYRLTGLD